MQLDEIVKDIGATVRTAVDRGIQAALADLEPRLKELEENQSSVSLTEQMQTEIEVSVQKTMRIAVEHLVTPDQVETLVKQTVTDEIAQIPRPQDGKSVSMDEVRPVLQDMVNALELPRGEKGEKGDGVDPDLVRRMITDEVAALPKPKNGKDGRDGTDGENGKDADPDVIKQLIADQVALLPPPKDGQDGQDGRDGVDGQDGKDADPDVIKQLVKDEVAALPKPKDGQDGRDGIDGKDADPDVIKQLVDEAVSALPPPKDGQDGRDGLDGKDADPQFIKQMVEDAVANLPPPKDGEPGRDGIDGKDADPDMIKQLIADQVSLLPPPKDGQDGKDGVDGTDGKDADPDVIKQLVRDEVAQIPPPKDGEPGRDGIDGKNADPQLIKQLVDEAVSALPPPKDGEPGRDGIDGKDADPIDMSWVELQIQKAVQEAVAKIVPPEARHGENGKDAAELEILPAIDESKSYARGCWALHKSGLWRSYERTHGMKGWECVVAGVDDLQADYDGERVLTLTVAKSSGPAETKEFVLPMIIDRGVYRDNQTYEKFDAVTFGGSLWIAQKNTPEGKPGTSKDWRLSVKKGRDANQPVKVGA